MEQIASIRYGMISRQLKRLPAINGSFTLEHTNEHNTLIVNINVYERKIVDITAMVLVEDIEKPSNLSIKIIHRMVKKWLKTF